jgi:hypothetical protein
VDQSRVSQVLDQIERELPNLNLQPAARTEASDLLEALRKLIPQKIQSATTRAIVAKPVGVSYPFGCSSEEDLLITQVF